MSEFLEVPLETIRANRINQLAEAVMSSNDSSVKVQVDTHTFKKPFGFNKTPAVIKKPATPPPKDQPGSRR